MKCDETTSGVVLGPRNWPELLLHPRYSLLIFSIALFLVYGVVPFIAWATLGSSESFLFLSSLTCLAIFSMWVGSKVPFFDHRFYKGAVWVRLNGSLFISIVWFIFFVFIAYTFATASSIPFLSALKGVDANVLSEARGAFLKGREGLEIALLYFSTLLANTLVPYSLVCSFILKKRFRYILFLFFGLYCVSFMQKALFLNAILPIGVYLSLKGRLTRRLATLSILGIFLLLFVFVFISYKGSEGDGFVAKEYLSASYLPGGALDYVLWRIFSVPIFTATDTLLVHRELFDSKYFFGATSGFLSLIFGLERINIERYVFEYQFGSWNDFANSNAVFFLDGFLNFGLFGVFIYGLIAGQIFRLIRYSNDLAFASLWPILAIGLFSGSLIGLLLSNGWAGLLLMTLLIRVATPVNYLNKNSKKRLWTKKTIHS